MLIKKLIIFNFVFLCLVAVISVGSAAAYTYTDTTTKDGFDIEYTLSISGGDGGNDYDAVFTINSLSTPLGTDWYIGAFDFKLFEGDGNIVPDITSDPEPNWGIADSDNPYVSIQGWSREAGSAGFYLTALEADQTPANAALGILVSAPNSATFSFSFANDGDLRELAIPFQVAYFDGEIDGEKNNGGLFFGQLSADLTIPEPATMLLVGFGLLGIAFVGRKNVIKRG